jgi:hypothetical protein
VTEPDVEEIHDDLFTETTHEHARVQYYPMQPDDIPFEEDDDELQA